MSELQDSLKRLYDEEYGHTCVNPDALTAIVDAARLVADPDYEAAMTCIGCRGSGVVGEDRPGFVTEFLGCTDCQGTGVGLPLEAVTAIVNAALGIDLPGDPRPADPPPRPPGRRQG